jgi:hypothetical protein
MAYNATDVPILFNQLAVSTVAVSLVLPTAAQNATANVSAPNYALIVCETNDVRWRDDGTNPTSSVGSLLKAGQSLKYNGPLASIKFIRVSADATLDVNFYA